MTDLNKVVLIGRLTRDAEMKYTTSTAVPVLTFSIAVNYRAKKGNEWVEEPNFFDVTYFGKMAETIGCYLTKSKQVAIEGEVRQDRWQDKTSGQNRSKIQIVANTIQLLSNGHSEAQQGAPQGQRQAAFKPRPQQQQVQQFEQYNDGFQEDLLF